MSEANKRTIRTVREEAMRKGKLDKLDRLYTDDYVYHGIPMLGDLRDGGKIAEEWAEFDALSFSQQLRPSR